MTDIDQFMQEEFMPFYKRVSDGFKQNHHTLYSVLNSFLSGKKNHFGIRITDNEKIVGEYTLHLDGVNVSHMDNEVLSSEIYTPFGIVKPYMILEKNIVENRSLMNPISSRTYFQLK